MQPLTSYTRPRSEFLTERLKAAEESDALTLDQCAFLIAHFPPSARNFDLGAYPKLQAQVVDCERDIERAPSDRVQVLKAMLACGDLREQENPVGRLADILIRTHDR